MARIKFLMACLLIACVCVSVTESIKFPLESCSTDDMDVLFLYTVKKIDFDYGKHVFLSLPFVRHLKSFPSNRTTPRVMTAAVYDRFSAHNPDVNVSSWQFGPSLESSTFGFDEQQQPVRQRYDSVENGVGLKIEFVQRLFSEMGGVRNEATKIAVVFLDGFSFSIQEARSIPGIVARQRTDIKIFAVVFGGELEPQNVVMDSTIILREYISDHDRFILVLAICNQCMEGWWTLEYSSGVDSLSCYHMVDMGSRGDSYFSQCYYEDHAYLVRIETKEELIFLRRSIISFLGEQPACNVSCQSTFHVSVYLSQVPHGVVKRFGWQHWENSFFFFRPVVVNHWLPGKPVGGKERGVWQFVWNGDTNGDRNISSRKGRFVDGWTDVGGHTRIRFRLCEIFLPRRIEETIWMRIKPATNESLSKALSKGNFVKFGDNIVSISAYISNPELVRSLNESDMFPLFDCGVDAANWRYISYIYVCDDIDHCSNRRDEVNCVIKTKNICSTGRPGVCTAVTCCDGSCLPVKFVNDGQIDCLVCDSGGRNMSTDESEVLNLYLRRNQTCAFICGLDKCVEFSQLNDGKRDCDGEDGPLDETIGKLKTADTCFNILGHNIWAPECVFVRDMYGVVMGCRDMSHLKNCSGFACPEGYVKCPNTYCIPLHYVRNGQPDCPKGEDEQRDNIVPCTGNFACWDSQVCLHPDLVCDGHFDCPHQDDELDCHAPLCPVGLRCVSGTVTVSNFNIGIYFDDTYYFGYNARYLDLSGVDLSGVSAITLGLIFDNLVIILLSNCSLRNLDGHFYYDNLRYLQKMDVSHNLLRTLDDRDVVYPALNTIRHLNLSYNKDLAEVHDLRLNLLDTLDLSHTSLAKLDQSFIGGFPNLKHLNLSFTFIDAFLGSHIPSSLILQSLDLRGLGLSRLFEDFFNSLTVSEHLYTDRFELCCPQIRGPSIPSHVCHAPVEAISSCFDLIGSSVQRVLLWVVAVLAVLGNMAVIVYRVIWDRSVLKTGYGLFVTNLGISDFIMGIYLFIIAGADYYYRDVYVLYDKAWRESGVCKFAGFLATLSVETSIFFVFLITVDRFLVMKFPFGQIKFSKVAKIITTILSWIIGFLLALTPIVMEFGIFSSNAMCLGLPLTAKRSSGWEFSFGVFIVLNWFLCLTLACGQRAIFRAMSESRITGSASSASPRRAADIMVAKQLSLIALSNFLCWFPVGCMGLLSVTGHEISNDVYAWTTIIVLPINSAANPLLYTIPVLLDKWDKFKHSGRRGASS